MAGQQLADGGASCDSVADGELSVGHERQADHQSGEKYVPGRETTFVHLSVPLS